MNGGNSLRNLLCYQFISWMQFKGPMDAKDFNLLSLKGE